jgi:hypothetical protein
MFTDKPAAASLQRPLFRERRLAKVASTREGARQLEEGLGRSSSMPFDRRRLRGIFLAEPKSELNDVMEGVQRKLVSML